MLFSSLPHCQDKPHTLKTYELKLYSFTLTILAMLSCNPNTRFNSLPLNQLTAYVFCATAKDSPPILKEKEGKHKRKHINCNMQSNKEAVPQLLAILR